MLWFSQKGMKMKIEKNPKCVDCKYNCFANYLGRCIILDKENANCSFYKTHEEYEKGKHYYEQRQHEIYNKRDSSK